MFGAVNRAGLNRVDYAERFQCQRSSELIVVRIKDYTELHPGRVAIMALSTCYVEQTPRSMPYLSFHSLWQSLKPFYHAGF